MHSQQPNLGSQLRFFPIIPFLLPQQLPRHVTRQFLVPELETKLEFLCAAVESLFVTPLASLAIGLTHLKSVEPVEINASCA